MRPFIRRLRVPKLNKHYITPAVLQEEPVVETATKSIIVPEPPSIKAYKYHKSYGS